MELYAIYYSILYITRSISHFKSAPSKLCLPDVYLEVTLGFYGDYLSIFPNNLLCFFSHLDCNVKVVVHCGPTSGYDYTQVAPRGRRQPSTCLFMVNPPGVPSSGDR